MDALKKSSPSKYCFLKHYFFCQGNSQLQVPYTSIKGRRTNIQLTSNVQCLLHRSVSPTLPRPTKTGPPPFRQEVLLLPKPRLLAASVGLAETDHEDCTKTPIGGLHKWGYPQNGWFARENPINMDDFGVNMGKPSPSHQHFDRW